MLRLLIILLPGILATQAYAAECTPTPHRTTGTHYEPVTRQQTDVGKGLKVTGQVLVAPNCTPLANAKIAHWQAGLDGHYSDKLRAYLYTDQQGRYAFETEWPELSPPHIHFIVTAKGYKKLETQWIGREPKKHIEFVMVVKKEDN